MTSQDPWAELTVDPRRPENAHLRASDADRALISQVLAEAYADGRLDRHELDERTAQLTAARTLGELPVLVSDLIAPVPAVPVPTGGLTPAQIHSRAVESYEQDRRQALWTMITATLVTTTIWLVIGWSESAGGFQFSLPWPLFVLLGTGLNYGRVVFERKETIAEETRRLERKEAKRRAKEIERRREAD